MNYVKDFKQEDWVSEAGEYHLKVQAAEHEKGMAPMIRVEAADDASYSEVLVSTSTDKNGNVKISINKNPFSGRVIVDDLC